jgi:hypothetical protein
MKFTHSILIVLVGLIGLTGCNGSEPESTEPETVFDPLVETLDKAKATQDLEQDRKRRIDAQLEQN